MGEYAMFNGRQVKIGTCEEMYYLRFDQRRKVVALGRNVRPVEDAAELRFRFPWPDEDHVEPGAFDPYERAVCIPGATCGGGGEHYSIQFSAPAGYLVSLPCPESDAPQPFKIHRNGWRGRVLLVQQRFIPTVGLVPVLMCGGCGAKYRLEERSEIEALAVACRVEGDTRDRQERISREHHDRKDGPHKWAPMPGAAFWHVIADRILEGISGLYASAAEELARPGAAARNATLT